MEVQPLNTLNWERCKTRRLNFFLFIYPLSGDTLYITGLEIKNLLSVPWNINTAIYLHDVSLSHKQRCWLELLRKLAKMEASKLLQNKVRNCFKLKFKLQTSQEKISWYCKFYSNEIVISWKGTIFLESFKKWS